jgi:hypothetical protein
VYYPTMGKVAVTGRLCMDKMKIFQRQKKFSFTRFWCSLALNIYMLVFQLVTLFNILGGYKLFRHVYCLYLQSAGMMVYFLILI